MDTNFMLQKRLKEQSPKLFENFKNLNFVMTKTLERVDHLFPYFTDHSTRHALIVIDFFERIIGEDNISLLNADEIYILLCAAYMHDFGMTIDEKTFFNLKDTVVTLAYQEAHPIKDLDDIRETIRAHHQLFSGLLIEKYSDFFEIPSQEHTYCIAQVCSGHRKAELFNEKEYPKEYKLPNGNVVRLPYLAALIRLADELDIGIDRNPIGSYEYHMDNINYRQHFAVKHVETTEDAFVMDIVSSEDEVIRACKEAAGKLDEVLHYCVRVIDDLTPFTIHQRKLILDIKAEE